MEYKLTFKGYNEALKENKLLGLKCQECGTITVPPKMVCLPSIKDGFDQLMVFLRIVLKIGILDHNHITRSRGHTRAH